MLRSRLTGTARLMFVTCIVSSLLACTATDSAPPASTPTPASDTTGTTIVPEPGTTPPPGTEVPAATEAPATTITVTPPADTTRTSQWATAPGNAIPGGPQRTKAAATPLPPGPCTETAGRVDRLTFVSNVLAVNQPQQHYLVYTPRCYRYDLATRYPVLYLFHGAQVDETQWETVGVFSAADRLIASGSIAPMIIVLPDAIWSMGTYTGEPPLFDRLVVGELLPAVEQDYRTAGTQQLRAIGGISRGGEWALLEAGRRPELFGAVGGHSPAVGLPSTPNSVLLPLFRTTRAQRIWLDVGSGDGLYGPVTTFDQGLTAAGIAHELHVGTGGHDNSYWAAHVDEYLSFYAAAFAGRNSR